MLIACIANGGYWRHTGAMLHSMLTHNASERPRVYVLHGEGEPQDGRDRLQAVATKFGTTVRFLEVPAHRVAAFPDRYFHRSIWYRALLPELLPDADRILYLDSDLVVLDSLLDLWRTDVSSHPFGAVINPLHRALRWYPTEVLGLPLREYFNSGVLLMNLEQLRRENLMARLIEYAAAHPENTCPDQDALNMVFRGCWLPLHPRWNLQTPLFDLPADDTPFPRQQLEDALARPAIVHFSGPFKPWQYLCRYPYRDKYFEHAGSTPWPAQALEGRSALNAVLRRLPPDWVYRYYILTEYRLRPAMARVSARWSSVRQRR